MDIKTVFRGDRAQDNSKKELSKQNPNTNLMQLRDYHNFREADSLSLVGTSSLVDASTRSLQRSDGYVQDLSSPVQGRQGQLDLSDPGLYDLEEDLGDSQNPKTSYVGPLPDRVAGFRRENVSGRGMNCSIRAILVSAGWNQLQREFEQLVTFTRSEVQKQAEQRNIPISEDGMLDLATPLGRLMIEVLRHLHFQGKPVLTPGRGMAVYSLDPHTGEPREQPTIPYGLESIRDPATGMKPPEIPLFLHGMHYQALIRESPLEKRPCEKTSSGLSDRLSKSLQIGSKNIKDSASSGQLLPRKPSETSKPRKLSETSKTRKTSRISIDSRAAKPASQQNASSRRPQALSRRHDPPVRSESSSHKRSSYDSSAPQPKPPIDKGKGSTSHQPSSRSGSGSKKDESVDKDMTPNQSSDGSHHSPVSYHPNPVFDLSPTYFINGSFHDHQTIDEFNDERIREIPGSGSKKDDSIDKDMTPNQSSDGSHHSLVSNYLNPVFDLSPTDKISGSFHDHQTIDEFNDERIREISGSSSEKDDSVDKGESSKTHLITEEELLCTSQNLQQKSQEGLAEYTDAKRQEENKDNSSVDRLFKLQTEVEKIRDMKRCLIIMSNRGSVEYQLRDGKLKPMLGAGGLATALHSIKEYGVPVKFVSAPMGKGDREVMDKGLPHGFVTIEDDEYNRYYNKISNEILWFTLHGMCNQVQSDSSKLLDNWESYTEVNRKFANTVSAEIRKEQGKEPVVMIQDYHLFQVSRMLREEHQNIILQQFIHVPWPEPEVWNVLPQEIVKDIYSGMSGNDIIGFQTKKDAKNFLKGAKPYLPHAEVDFQTGTVRCNEHNTQVHFYPISISVDEVRKKANSESAKQNINDEGQKQIKNTLKEAENIHGFPEKIHKILRVDRMDPTKNIVRGFQAYACLLEKHPELREKVIFVACLVPSRGEMRRYQELKREIESEIDKINNLYGNNNWQPIHAFIGNDQARALAEMQSYDALLVNPNKDGMNLVAKEGVAINQNDGVLILSQTAGAFHELKDGVIPLVSPSNLEETAKALKKALDMSPEERKIKAATARKVVEHNDLTLWLSKQLHDINHITPLLPSWEGRMKANNSDEGSGSLWKEDVVN